MSCHFDNHRVRILDSLNFQWTLSERDQKREDEIERLTPAEIQFRHRMEQLCQVKDVCGNCNEKKHIIRIFPNNRPLYA
jgi:hypothetical protein